jgi:hypothetical protein
MAKSQYAIANKNPDELQEFLAMALGGGQIGPNDLDRINVPPGGALQWTLPTLAGEVTVDAIEGVIIHITARRAYWHDEFSGQNENPDCVSNDGFTGQGNPGGNCITCPMSQWGSGGEKSQACKDMRLVFIIREGDLLPTVVKLPPTSIKPFRQYMLRLANQKAKHTGQVITKLTLKKVHGAFTYSIVDPAFVRELVEEEEKAIRNYIGWAQPAFRAPALAEHSDN